MKRVSALARQPGGRPPAPSRPGLAPSPAVPSPPLQDRLAVTSRSERQTEFLRAKVLAAMELVRRQHPEEGPWSDPEGSCLDLAGKWYPHLRAAGLPVAITVVDPALRPPGQAVAPGMAGKFHAFLTLDDGRGQPLIIDASWRQFVAGAATRTDLPEAFVGTSAQLRQMLAREKAHLRIELHDDPLQGHRKPDQLVDLAYGEGPHAMLRQVLPPMDTPEP